MKIASYKVRQPYMEGNEMKTLFSNIVVALLLLLVAHTVSAIPISATEADYSALSTQPTSSQYAGSSLHSAFRSIRNFAVRHAADDVTNVADDVIKVADDVTNEAILIGVGDSLETVPVTSERDSVNVSEPSLVALIAIGLVAVGFVHRRKNIK